MKISKEAAIKIAGEEAARLGYDIKTMAVKVTKYDTAWNEYLPEDSKSDYMLEKQNQLKGRIYLAVYYYHGFENKGMAYKGGDICIFIDTKDGSVVTTYRGK